MIPERFEKQFNQWMENIEDWCISRQLWWGHQVPAWYHKETGEVYVGKNPPADLENWKQDERCPRYMVFKCTMAIFNTWMA